MLVKNVATVVRTKISTEQLDATNYISTDNMLPNYSGITLATNVPSGTVTQYRKDDILLSNIRPYFKKVWLSDRNGGCNADIICIRVSDERCVPQYLYYQLITDNFINNYVKACKGAKMPRGDLNQLLEYDFYCPPYEEQLRITDILGSIDKKIEINKKKIEKLEAISMEIFLYFETFSNHNISTFSELIKDIISGDWGKESCQGIYNLKVNCIRGADIETCKNNVASSKQRFINLNNTSKLLNNKSLIVEISGGSPTQSTGRILYVNEKLIDRFKDPIICSNFCKAMTLKNDLYLYWFYLKWEYSYRKGVMFNFEGKTSGIKNFMFDNFVSSYEIKILPQDNIVEFNETVEPMFQEIQQLCKENDLLKKHKETLLPLLMNGQVTVT